MNSKPLYSSKIFNTYLKLLRQKHAYVDIRRIVDHAGIKPQEIADTNHWFNLEQFNRFHEKIVQATGEAHIAREAGRFLAAPEAIGFLRHYLLGMVSPIHAFRTLQRGPISLCRSCQIDIQSTASNQVDITVQPLPGVQEPPSLCPFRTGLFEAIVTTFNLAMPEVEHPQCLLKGDACCRYRITWKSSFYQTFQRIRNLCGLAALAGSMATGLLAPALALTVVLPLSVTCFCGLSFIADQLQKKNLTRSIHHLRNSSEQMLEQIRNNYNNALLTNEISHAISSKTSLDDILTSVVQTLGKHLNFRRGMILLSDAGGNRLEFRKGFGLSKCILERLQNTVFSLKEKPAPEIFTLAFAKKTPVLVHDGNGMRDGLPAPCCEFLRGIDSRAMICCPILCDGKALGVLAVDNPASRHPRTQSDLNLLTGLANVLGISIRNAQLLASRKRQFNSMLHVLAATIDARDPLTAGH
jgi:hypothetical protein